MSRKSEILTPKMIENLLKSDKINKIQSGKIFFTKDTLIYVKRNIEILTKDLFLNFIDVNIDHYGKNRLTMAIKEYRKRFLNHFSRKIIVTDKLENNKYIKKIKGHTLLFTKQFFIDAKALIETTKCLLCQNLFIYLRGCNIVCVNG